LEASEVVEEMPACAPTRLWPWSFRVADVGRHSEVRPLPVHQRYQMRDLKTGQRTSGSCALHSCKKQFTVRIGTVWKNQNSFASLGLRNVAHDDFKERRCGLGNQTALPDNLPRSFVLLHRIRFAMTPENGPTRS